jgi:hypothetical protein
MPDETNNKGFADWYAKHGKDAITQHYGGVLKQRKEVNLLLYIAIFAALLVLGTFVFWPFVARNLGLVPQSATKTKSCKVVEDSASLKIRVTSNMADNVRVVSIGGSFDKAYDAVFIGIRPFGSTKVTNTLVTINAGGGEVFTSPEGQAWTAKNVRPGDTFDLSFKGFLPDDFITSPVGNAVIFFQLDSPGVCLIGEIPVKP